MSEDDDMLDDSWERLDCAAGEVVIRQGEIAAHLYLLLSGRLVVVRNDEAETPDEATIRERGVRLAYIDRPRTLFGESGLFLGTRIVSILCHSDTCALARLPVPDGDWHAMLQEHPPVAVEICRLLARRVAATSSRLRQSTTFAGTVDRGARHFAREFVAVVDAAETALKNRTFTEMNPELRTISEGLHAFRTSNLYTRAAATASQPTRESTRALPREELHVQTLTLAPGEVLFEEGQSGAALYLLGRGEMDVYMGDQLVGVILPDEYVGEIGLLHPDESRRSATVIARTASELARVCDSFAEFARLADEQPWLPASLAHVLASRLQQYDRRLGERVAALRQAVTLMGQPPEPSDVMLARLADLLARHKAMEDLSRRARTLATRVQQMRDNLTRELNEKIDTLSG